MQYTMSKPIIPALALTCAALTATSFAQEFKPGDEVVALRDRELKIGREPVASVRKGQKLTVEQVQDNWLWVRSGETRGWIDNRSVIGADLVSWYERQDDMASSAGAEKALDHRVDEHGEGRARILGVTFQVLGLRARSKPGILIHAGDNVVIDDGNTISGMGDPGWKNVVIRGPDGTLRTWPRDGVNIEYGGVKIVIERVRDLSRTLSVNSRPYGIVQPGSHVLINESREVFVNGELRKPRG